MDSLVNIVVISIVLKTRTRPWIVWSADSSVPERVANPRPNRTGPGGLRDRSGRCLATWTADALGVPTVIGDTKLPSERTIAGREARRCGRGGLPIRTGPRPRESTHAGSVTMVGRTQLIDKLRELARNLWWTWQPNVIALFRELDPALWRKVDHNPVEFLKRLPAEQLERRAAEMALDSRIDYAFRRLTEYLKDSDSWGAVHASILRARPVAYFSAEFGLHESLPIYSGGLGVLAGDHLKSASDLGIPLVAIGLLYAQGYFRQTLDANGWQQEHYLNADTDLLPIESMDGTGRPAAAGRHRDGHRRAARAGLAGGRRPDHAAAPGRERAGEQRIGPVADGAALRRRRADPDPPGAAAGRRRGAGPARDGDPTLGPASQRGP